MANDSPNPHDHGQCESRMLEAAAGAAIVEVRLKNGRFGDAPPFRLVVDWRPGMEACDAEAFALQMVQTAALGLLKDLQSLIDAKVAPGDG